MLRSFIGMTASGNEEIRFRLGRVRETGNGPFVYRFPWGEFKYVSRRLLVGQFEEIFINGFYGFRSSARQPVIIDCGGNMGLSAVYFQLIYPEAKLTVFEPDPNLANLIRSNLGSAGFSGAEVVEAAAWIDDGEVEFAMKGDDSGGITEMGGTRVKAVDLARHLPPRVDLLKLDIEGAEFSVLARLHATGALLRVSNLVVEFHVTRERLDEVLESLKELRGSGMQVAFTAQLDHWIGEADEEAPFPSVGRRQNLMLVYAWRSARRMDDATGPVEFVQPGAELDSQLNCLSV